MEELLRLCDALNDLTIALQTALLAEDITTFARIVQGRTPILERCIVLWERATEDERAPFAAKLRDVVDANALMVQSGEEWLQATRKKLVQMHRGVQAMHRYRAPLVLMPPPKTSI